MESNKEYIEQLKIRIIHLEKQTYDLVNRNSKLKNDKNLYLSLVILLIVVIIIIKLS